MSTDHSIRVNAGPARGYIISWECHYKVGMTSAVQFHRRVVDLHAAERFAKKHRIEAQLRAVLRGGEVIEWDR